jgi:CBS domain containing-hemolysin-like protein
VTPFADADPLSARTLAGLLLVPALILVNAFFVAAEFALVAIRRTRVEELVNQGRPRAKSLLAAIDALNDSVAAAQLGITVASLALGFVSEPALHALLAPLFAFLPEPWSGAVGHTLSVALTLALVTFLHVVFGEQMPKIAALQSAERLGLLIAPPLNLFARFTRPLVWAMNGTSAWFLRRLGYDADAEEGEVHSVDELKLLVEDTEEAGLLDPEQADVVMNVFGLSAKRVRDVMVPRERVAALELTMKPEQVLEAVRNGAHTRMPVYDGEWDRIVGVVNTKDLFYLFSLKGAVVLEDAVYEPLYLRPDATVADALKEFKRSHRHLAVVRDEDRKTLGILTLEDVLEEIVGDIEDEHDVPVPKLRRTAVQKLMMRRRLNRGGRGG